MRARDPLENPEPLIRRVYSYVAYRIGEGPDAQDVTADVIERALRYRDSYDSRKGDPLSWLLGIARREIGDAALRALSLAEPPEVAAPGDLEDDTADRLALFAALAGLNDRDRELVALRYGADLSARQIAALLEMRINTVEVALHRALSRLRADLQADSAEEAPLS